MKEERGRKPRSLADVIIIGVISSIVVGFMIMAAEMIMLNWYIK